MVPGRDGSPVVRCACTKCDGSLLGGTGAPIVLLQGSTWSGSAAARAIAPTPTAAVPANTMPRPNRARRSRSPLPATCWISGDFGRRDSAMTPSLLHGGASVVPSERRRIHPARISRYMGDLEACGEGNHFTGRQDPDAQRLPLGFGRIQCTIRMAHRFGGEVRIVWRVNLKALGGRFHCEACAGIGPIDMRTPVPAFVKIVETGAAEDASIESVSAHGWHAFDRKRVAIHRPYPVDAGGEPRVLRAREVGMKSE